jgi:hypothetical protein
MTKNVSHKIHAQSNSDYSVLTAPSLKTRYDQNLFEVLAVTPYRFFCYWEITEQLIDDVRAKLGQDCFALAKPCLRLSVLENPTRLLKEETVISLSPEGCWYVNFEQSLYESPLQFELGYLLPDKAFLSLMRQTWRVIDGANSADNYFQGNQNGWVKPIVKTIKTNDKKLGSFLKITFEPASPPALGNLNEDKESAESVNENFPLEKDETPLCDKDGVFNQLSSGSSRFSP